MDSRERSEIEQIEAGTSKMQAEIRNIDYMQELYEKRYELDKTLGFMGIETERRGQDLGYNASIYGANKSYAGSVYNADTNFNIANLHSPSGRSGSFRNYAAGTRDILSGFGDIIHGRSDVYENYDNTSETTFRDKNGVTHKSRQRRTGKRKK